MEPSLQLAPASPRHCGSRSDVASTNKPQQPLATSHLGRPPLPGHGATLERWRMLAMVAAYDLSLAKLYEGHADAIAILSELAGPLPAAGSSKTQLQENEMDVPLLIQVARRGRGAGGGGS